VFCVGNSKKGQHRIIN